MYKLSFFISIFLCLSCYKSNGQELEYIAVPDAEKISWENYTPPGKKFIIAGEAHHVSSIFSFQLSHLKYLLTNGFRNLVWEMPYSYCLIGQEYIRTGNESLLPFIAWSNEDLVYWKNVHLLNETLAEDDKLHLWGIDLELGDNVSGSAYRVKLFKKALSLLADGKGQLPVPLQQPYHSLDTATSVQTVTFIKHQLQQLESDQGVIAYYGDRYPHFKILVNRLDYYKTYRNDDMLEAFKEICHAFHLASSAKFLGRFGWGHTDKSFKKSISWLLENDPTSPVRGNTYTIGVQYLDCNAWNAEKEIHLDNIGIVNNRKEKKTLEAFNHIDPSPIKIFNRINKGKEAGWTKAADVLFVFSGYPAITPLKK